jgi:CubicO group peptidase (beta-lactamase class C family)
MQEFSVPGMAVAVVKDGQVVHAKGYGVRRAGAPDAADADTLFGIASNTKAFTCTAISILAEDGKLDWDDPVTKHLPDFQMYDPWVSRELTLRDLVTHRGGLGLGQGDLMWWPATDFTRREIVRALRLLKPASSLRSRYAYSNVMYVVAGEGGDAGRGPQLGRISCACGFFEPLGMWRTNTSVSTPAVNVASPHLELGGAAQPIAPMAFEQLRRSRRDQLERLRHGALATDAARVRPRGRQRRRGLPAEARVDPQAVVGADRARHARPAARPRGAARELLRVRPRLRPARLSRPQAGLAHGWAAGYVSQVALVPEERLGLVVLTNQ